MSSVALGTTALTDFWPDGDDLLLLGPWCRTPENAGARAERRIREAPCPWDAPGARDEARKLLDRTYEATLAALAEHLNDVHGVAHSLRYWRILLGPWLIGHLHPLYDRYLQLVRTLGDEPELRTVAMDPASFRIPETTWESVSLVLGDPYNLQLYSQVLAFLGHEAPALPFAWPEEPDSRLGTTVRSIGRFLLSRDRFGPWPSGTLVEMYADPALVRRVAAGSGFGVRRMPKPRRVRAALGERRLALAGLQVGLAELDRLVAATLPSALPAVFLEGYEAEAARGERLARDARVVVSANGWPFTDPFKYAAGAAAERGARLIAVQHGGGYGMSAWLPFEDHEEAVSDAYFVWGWADDARGRENLPSLTLARLARTEPPADGDLLLITTSHPPYVYRLQSHPLGAQWERYVDDQARFVASLPAALRDRLVVREGQPTFGRDFDGRLAAAHPQVRFDHELPFAQALAHARCAVVDHCTTVFLETIALDVPTVAYWEPSLWPMRQSAREPLALLERAGILHETPESAAVLLERVWPDLSAWWNGGDVRDARAQLLTRYALGSPDPVRDWSARLRLEMGLA